MTKNLTKAFCKNKGELLKKDGVATVTLLDADLDPITFTFSEGCIELDTNELSYVNLTPENLETLLRLQPEAEAYLEQYFEEEEE